MKTQELETDSQFDIVLGSDRDSVRITYCSDDIDILIPAPAAALRSDRIVYPEMAILKTSFENIDVGLSIEKVYGNLYNMKVQCITRKQRL